MKGKKRVLLLIVLGATAILMMSVFMVSTPDADITVREITEFEAVDLRDIQTQNNAKGFFTSTVDIRQSQWLGVDEKYYGQEISIEDNPKVDFIRVGITNSLKSRIEVWKGNTIVAQKDLGFMSKMKKGQKQTLSVEFYDKTNSRYPGESKVKMRFYKGSGFLGDIGTLSLDLTTYGDLSGPKAISVFSKSMEEDCDDEAAFSNLRIWKNYRTFD